MRRTLPTFLTAAALVAGCGSSHPAGGGPGGRPSPSHTTGRAQLIGMLGVLRRAPTATDTPPALAATLAQAAHYPGCLAQVADSGLTRRVGTVPGGAGLYLVAFRPARCQVQCTGTGRSCMRRQPDTEWTALAVEPGRLPQLFGEWTARDIAAGQAVGFLPSPIRGGTLTVAVLLPDKVARVRMSVGPLGHPPTHTVSVGVHGNVAVLATGPNTNVELKSY